jgi:hypothetical protein
VRELLLVDTDDGEVLGRMTLADDGTVTTDDGTAPILTQAMRRTELGERETFEYLLDAGWANGPLALRRA